MASAPDHRDAAAVKRWARILLVTGASLSVLLGSAWYWLLHTESGARTAFNFAVSMTDGQLSGEVPSGNISDGVLVRHLGWDSDGVNLKLEGAELAANLDLLPPRLEITRAELFGVEVGLTPDPDARGMTADEMQSVIAGLEIPLDLVVHDLKVHYLNIRNDEAVLLAVDALELAASWHEHIEVRRLSVEAPQGTGRANGTLFLLDTPAFDLALEIAGDVLVAEAEVSGNVDAWRLRASGDYVDERMGSLNIMIDGHGDLGMAKVESLQVSGEGLDVDGSVEAIWEDETRVDAALVVQSFPVARLAEGWPEAHPLAGRLQLSATSGVVSVEDSELRLLDSDAVVLIDATVDRDNGDINAHLRWSSLQWPIASDEPLVTSLQGDVKATGVFDAWTVAGDIDLGTREMPDGRFTLTGSGNREQARAEIGTGRAFGGSVTGDIEYRWLGDQPWTANLALAEVQLGTLLPEWPGQVSGRLEAFGTARPTVVNAELIGISGELRGESLRAGGKIVWSVAGLSANELLIEHGGSRLWLHGSDRGADGLQFEASIDELQAYSTGAAGSAELSGLLCLNPDAPFVDITATSDLIEFGEMLVSEFVLTNHRQSGAIAGLGLTASELRLAGQSFNDIDLKVDYLTDAQNIVAAVSSQGARLSLAADGALDDWRDPGESTWRGSLQELQVAVGDDFNLGLEQPVSMDIARSRLDIETVCLTGDQDAGICVESEWSADGHLDARVDLERVPMTLVEYFANTGLHFDQLISGAISWSRDPQSGATGGGELKLSAGRISSSNDPDLGIQTEPGTLRFDIENDQLLAARMDIPMPDTGRIDGDFKVLDVYDVASSGIEGHLDVDFSDIGIISHLTPLIDDAAGHGTFDLLIAGTTASPRLTGSLGIEAGRLSYTPLGLDLEDIELRGNITESRAIELGGTFTAGEGRGTIKTSAELDDVGTSGMHFTIAGDNLRLVDVADVQAVATVDVYIDYRDDTLAINGSVDIPHARVMPANLSENRVVESEDVVIVAGQLPGVEENPQPRREKYYEGELELSFGDDVVINLDVARANLSGSTRFRWSGPPMPVANGRYDLVGNIQAFGQLLEISEGGIRFNNVEANHPYIRLRAERDIFGNSQVKRAGVLVDGDARRPTVEAYTVPLTTEERALTLLVTGSDFDLEQGVGAVDFGTYIAPRLFVSYGVGIFDRDNVISARYDLNRGFGIKVSSGNQQSGVDINYRIEN